VTRPLGRAPARVLQPAGHAIHFAISHQPTDFSVGLMLARI
jgi:hypothetical protein